MSLLRLKNNQSRETNVIYIKQIKTIQPTFIRNSTNGINLTIRSSLQKIIENVGHASIEGR